MAEAAPLDRAAHRFSRQFSMAARGMGDKKPYYSTKAHVRISEAKDLLGKDLNGLSDPYCVVKVDDEVVARTSTVFKSLNPFFGEEFFLDLAHAFKQLTVYVFDQDRVGQDDPLGKVEISCTDLAKNAELASDAWYPLVRVSRDTEVFGEILIELLLSETDTGLDHLTVTVLRARDLLAKDVKGNPDPVAVVELDGQKEQTERVKQCRYPVWNTHFSFERAKLGPTLVISVRDGKNLLGMLSGLERDIPRKEWHRLQPSPAALAKHSEGAGSLRLSVKYTQEMILPLPSYRQLVDFLEEDIHKMERVETGLVAILEETLIDRSQTVSDREQVARTLIRILLRRNKCVVFLKALNGLEISKATETSTLFRGNSMATKCTDQFMKIVGLHYLHETLKGIIDDIFKEKKDCEIDPTKLGPRKADKDVDKHATHLIAYLERMFDSIFESVDRCPYIMRIVFKHLRESLAKNEAVSEKEDTNAAYTVVSGFLFLRFFAPAVLSPKLFGMRSELADARTSRTLTLLAKALQSVGNLGSTIGSGKESYMEPLHPVITTNLERVRVFIDNICSVKEASEVDMQSAHEDVTDDDAVIVQGVLNFRIDPSGVVSSKTFKKKTFTLTSRMLVFEKPGALDTREVYPINAFKVVEPVELAAFDKRFVIQIVAIGKEPLFIQLGSELEYNVWLQALRKACRRSGAKVVNAHHANVFRGGKYACCKQKEVMVSPGCSKSHNSISIDQFADSPPPEFWTHKLFAVLLASKQNLELKYKGDGPVAEGDLPKKAPVLKLLAIIDDIHLAHLLHQES